jgi:hypothetical protein
MRRLVEVAFDDVGLQQIRALEQKPPNRARMRIDVPH